MLQVVFTYLGQLDFQQPQKVKTYESVVSSFLFQKIYKEQVRVVQENRSIKSFCQLTLLAT